MDMCDRHDSLIENCNRLSYVKVYVGDLHRQKASCSVEKFIIEILFIKDLLVPDDMHGEMG